MVSQANINDGKQLEEMSRQLYKLLDKKPVFMCIGTEKVCSDSLGPLVGQLLNDNMRQPAFVYGIQGYNITAENVERCHKFIKQLHPDSTLVVVDAGVGDSSQVGCIQLTDGNIIPGAATEKKLVAVGDVSLIGIVSERNMADFYCESADKNRLVFKTAQKIAEIILATQQIGNKAV